MATVSSLVSLVYRELREDQSSPSWQSRMWSVDEVKDAIREALDNALMKTQSIITAEKITIDASNPTISISMRDKLKIISAKVGSKMLKIRDILLMNYEESGWDTSGETGEPQYMIISEAQNSTLGTGKYNGNIFVSFYPVPASAEELIIYYIPRLEFEEGGSEVDFNFSQTFIRAVVSYAVYVLLQKVVSAEGFQEAQMYLQLFEMLLGNETYISKFNLPVKAVSQSEDKA